MKHKILLIILTQILLISCGIYSFSGTSIQPDVKTINIEYFEYKALTVNPSLSNMMTEALQDKFRKMTRLTQVSSDADLTIEGDITGYSVTAQAITAEEVAAQNRLTVTVKVKFTNKKYPDENFDRSFSGFADFDATQNLEAVQNTLCEEIVEKICEDIFNATVANW